MINTVDFKTRSEILERDMPKIKGNNQYKGKTIIALDGGYSGVKGASPNKVFCFPSYAKRKPDALEVVGKIKASDIQFRDNATGEEWIVGQAAETLMDQSDIDSTTDASIYTRYRYDSPMYRVLMATGLAIGLWGTGAGNEIYLQTGLPATYKERDEKKLVSALVGDYDVSVKIGNSEWVDFRFSLDEEHIGVIEQPQGTVCATAYDNGVMSREGRDILSSNTIVLDIGFGTEDIFSILGGYKNSHQTYSDTGMRAVFEGVIKKIVQNSPDAEIKIFELQKFLESGKATFFNYDNFATESVEFADILEAENKALCEKSIKRLIQEYGKLLSYKYLIVTGGTGESRFEQIKQMLSGISSLQVLPGNINTPDLAFSYSNVIGYYMLRHAKLKAAERALEASRS